MRGGVPGDRQRDPSCTRSDERNALAPQGMSIRIVEAEWGKVNNVALVECEPCKRKWGHKRYRERCVCPCCGKSRSFKRMKEEYLEEIGEE